MPTLNLLKRSDLARGLTNAEEDANKTSLETFVNAILDGTTGYIPAKAALAANASQLNGVNATPAVGGGANTLPMLDASGHLLVGATSGAYHKIYKYVAADAGNTVLDINNVTSNSVTIFAVSGYGVNASNAALKVGKDANTASIRAGGVILASGADYAEYERKADGCGIVAKGQIIGFDSDGRITDKWVSAHSFGVKTTDPSYVGGDTWGSVDVVGKRPEPPSEDAEQFDKDQYTSCLAIFESQLEAERQKVDRIAYSGKVPCNVTNASVGDYIIADRDGDYIKGLPVSSPTFDQYQKCIGRVRRILEDGRSEIAVIIH